MLVALDFESDAIEVRPKYPPKPAGLAVYYFPDDAPRKRYYYAWGHPTENNCSYDEGREALKKLLEDPRHEYVFHNAPFDCSIIEEKMGLTVPWERVHDTMLQAFLLDPYGELSLKPLAELHLGKPPTERDAVRDWLVANGVCRSNDKQWGACIAKAPGSLVGEYAIGDVERTYELYLLFKEALARIAQGRPSGLTRGAAKQTPGQPSGNRDNPPPHARLGF